MSNIHHALARIAFVVGVLLGLHGLAATAAAQNACLGGKIKCVGAKDACLLNVYAGALKKGVPPDAAKIQKCQSKFDDPVKGCFEKLEAANKGPCITFDDVGPLEFRVDAFLDDVRADLETGPALDVCASAKEKCIGQDAKCLLGQEANAAKKGTLADVVKLQKCRDKLAACFAKAEAKSVCNTTDDLLFRSDAVDAHVDGVVNDLNSPPLGCDCCATLPALLALTSLGSDGTSTGIMTPATCADGSSCVTDADCADFSKCIGPLRGGTLYAGGGSGGYSERPIPYLAVSYLKIASCTSGDPNLTPTTSAEVAAVGPVCATPPGTPTWGQRHCTSPGCYVGAPVDIGTTGDACGINTIAAVGGAGTGTLTCGTGEMDVSLPLDKAAYSGFCPKCLGGTLGACGSGVCSGGTRNGLSCTPETKEDTSLDCPPNPTLFGTVSIGQAGGTTGTETLSSFSLGFFPNAFCGYCTGNPSLACTNNAMCVGFGSCSTHSGGAFGRTNATFIGETGTAPGLCVATGSHPLNLVDVGCVPAATAGVISSSAGLPGPYASSVRGLIEIIP